MNLKKAVVLVLVVVVVAYFLIDTVLPVISVKSYGNHSFVVDQEFQEIRKTLINSDITEQMAARNNGQVLYKKRDRLDLRKGEGLLPKYWEIETNETIQVKLYDPDLGEYVMWLRTHNFVGTDKIVSQTKMVNCSNPHIEDYQTTLVFSASDNQTLVEIQQYTKIKHRAPSSYKEFIQTKVDTATHQSLFSGEKILRKTFFENRGRFVFPFMRRR